MSLARDQIFEQWRPLVRHVLRERFASHCSSRSGIEFDDLVQEGNIALLRAIDQYRPDEGTSFKTYAYRTILNSLITFVQGNQSLIRVPIKPPPTGRFKVDRERARFCESIHKSVRVGAEPMLLSNLLEAKAACPQRLIEDRELLRVVLGEVRARLSRSEYRLFVLAMRGNTYASMAQEYSVSRQWIHKRLQAIRAKIHPIVYSYAI